VKVQLTGLSFVADSKRHA